MNQDVVSLAKSILDLVSDRCGKEELEFRLRDFRSALYSESNVDAIQEAIGLDTELWFPVDEKIMAYRRMIQLGNESPELLREFAGYLLMHGPDWDEEANSLYDRADKIEELE